MSTSRTNANRFITFSNSLDYVGKQMDLISIKKSDYKKDELSECKIMIRIQVVYDLSIKENWDDKCILWTVEDNGSTYKTGISLIDSMLVKKENKNISLLFKNVITNKKYSCVIDQGGGKFIVLFQNVLINNSMQYYERKK